MGRVLRHRPEERIQAFRSAPQQGQLCERYRAHEYDRRILGALEARYLRPVSPYLGQALERVHKRVLFPI